MKSTISKLDLNSLWRNKVVCGINVWKNSKAKVVGGSDESISEIDEVNNDHLW